MLRTGEVPPALKRRGSLCKADDVLFEVFQALSRERFDLGEMGGTTIHPIRSAHVAQYCREVLGLSDLEQVQEICFIVARMDEEYLTSISKKRQASSEAKSG